MVRERTPEQQRAIHAKRQDRLSKRKLELDTFFEGTNNRQKFMEKLIRPKLTVDKFGNKIFSMENSRLDFSEDFVFKGVTKAGNVKLGDVFKSSPEGLTTKNIVGQPALSSSGKKKELFVKNFSFIEDL